MSIIKNLKLSRLFYVILVSLFYITTLSLNGYCKDSWVPVGKTDDYTDYYNSSTIKIDKANKIIKVWLKSIYTEKGKINLLKGIKVNEKQNYKDISYKLTLLFFNYGSSKFGIDQVTCYSQSNQVLYNRECQPEWKNVIQWRDIISGSDMDYLLNRILKNNNIER